MSRETHVHVHCISLSCQLREWWTSSCSCSWSNPRPGQARVYFRCKGSTKILYIIALTEQWTEKTPHLKKFHDSLKSNKLKTSCPRRSKWTPVGEPSSWKLTGHNLAESQWWRKSGAYRWITYCHFRLDLHLGRYHGPYSIQMAFVWRPTRPHWRHCCRGMCKPLNTFLETLLQ